MLGVNVGGVWYLAARIIGDPNTGRASQIQLLLASLVVLIAAEGAVIEGNGHLLGDLFSGRYSYRRPYCEELSAMALGLSWFITVRAVHLLKHR